MYSLSSPASALVVVAVTCGGGERNGSGEDRRPSWTGSEDEIDTVAGTSLTGGGERRWDRARSAATGVHHPLHGVRALRS
jgi:hypothetical protein